MQLPLLSTIIKFLHKKSSRNCPGAFLRRDQQNGLNNYSFYGKIQPEIEKKVRFCVFLMRTLLKKRKYHHKGNKPGAALFIAPASRFLCTTLNNLKIIFVTI